MGKSCNGIGIVAVVRLSPELDHRALLQGLDQFLPSFEGYPHCFGVEAVLVFDAAVGSILQIILLIVKQAIYKIHLIRAAEGFDVFDHHLQAGLAIIIVFIQMEGDIDRAFCNDGFQFGFFETDTDDLALIGPQLDAQMVACRADAADLCGSLTAADEDGQGIGSARRLQLADIIINIIVEIIDADLAINIERRNKGLCSSRLLDDFCEPLLENGQFFWLHTEPCRLGMAAVAFQTIRTLSQSLL